MNTTSFKVIQAEAKERFGVAPSMYQVRLWWFGAGRGKTSPEKVAHRSHVEREVAEWEIIIRLALRYAKKNLESGLAAPKVWGFIYHLIWSDYKRYQDATARDGQKFKGATWWMWAIENKNGLVPTMSKKGYNNMQQGLNKMINAMQKGMMILFFIFLLASLVHGAELLAWWAPNSEADLKGYKVYYGVESGNYTHIQDVGDVIMYVAKDLESNTRYYFVITAYDIVGNESEFSQEVSAVTTGAILKGDITKDFRLSAADAIEWRRLYIEGQTDELDITGNGRISLADYVELKRLILEAQK